MAAAGGELLVKNVIPKHLDCISAKLVEMGVDVEEQDDAVLVRRSGPITRTNVKTMPYPGFPTDMQPQIAAVLCLAQGTSVLTEGVWDNRYRYVDEFRRMGAHIQVDGKVAVIDHHRKGVGFIEKADLVCHEPMHPRPVSWSRSSCSMWATGTTSPTASSRGTALRHHAGHPRLHPPHRRAHLRAAAALRRYGAETEHVRQLFDVSMVEYTTKAMLVSEARCTGLRHHRQRRGGPRGPGGHRPGGQRPADIQNVEASFVAVQVGGGVNISARSLGAVNVQVIMESLGGGGHQTMAAAQLKHITPEAARSRIQTAIDQYREAQKKSGLESGSEQKKKDKQ